MTHGPQVIVVGGESVGNFGLHMAIVGGFLALIVIGCAIAYVIVERWGHRP